MLDVFFESISWPIEPPAAYGVFHILFTLLGFALCALTAWRLRKVSDRIAGRILFACGLVLSLSEVFKQFFAIMSLLKILIIGESFRFSCAVLPCICA